MQVFFYYFANIFVLWFLCIKIATVSENIRQCLILRLKIGVKKTGYIAVTRLNIGGRRGLEPRTKGL